MKPVAFHPQAQAEFFAAQDYYEQCVGGLGLEFRNEVRSAVDTIQAAPDRWSPHRNETRFYLVHRFPFAVIYLDLPKQIWVVAIAHLRRRPGYWVSRLR